MQYQAYFCVKKERILKVFKKKSSTLSAILRVSDTCYFYVFIIIDYQQKLIINASGYIFIVRKCSICLAWVGKVYYAVLF